MTVAEEPEGLRALALVALGFLVVGSGVMFLSDSALPRVAGWLLLLAFVATGFTWLAGAAATGATRDE